MKTAPLTVTVPSNKIPAMSALRVRRGADSCVMAKGTLRLPVREGAFLFTALREETGDA